MERIRFGANPMISYVRNPRARTDHASDSLLDSFSPLVAGRIRRFHQSFPPYKPTPLISLTHLARSLSVEMIWIKDESLRFGLNAFKVLGASHAIATLLAAQAGRGDQELSFDSLKKTCDAEGFNDITFVTATDGNHGRAVAWTAHQFGCKAVVFMPKGTVPSRLHAIEALGADASIIDGTYDDAVRLAADKAKTPGWFLLQDTAWKGYERTPLHVMQGYLTLLTEALEQLRGKTPTHVFAQCGVGSFAAALQAYLVNRIGQNRPVFAVVEAENAACYYESLLKQNPDPCSVTGEMDTIMAGLACGEPSMLGWEILRRYSDVFFACDDAVAIKGMQLLGRPLPGDHRIISGESGAVTAGLLYYLRKAPAFEEISNALGIDRRSRILLISTEGDTDPDMYRSVLSATPVVDSESYV